MATSKKNAFPVLSMMKNKGILLVDKAQGSTSFRLVSLLRRITKIDKIGHSGTLDPFATGLMVLLIGREFTKRSDEFLGMEKEYEATIHLGIATDTYDVEGQIISRSETIPTPKEIELAIQTFQGTILQVPPMFSAKKVQGKKLYELARKGIEIQRQPVQVQLQTRLLRYQYPELSIHVVCSKGTYIRSLAHDLGHLLGVGGHLSSLRRLRSGTFHLEEAIPQSALHNPSYDITPHLKLI